jgi:GNAT superfamily N-acetyltransferase
MPMTLPVRKIESRDESRWRELWDGYNRFYQRQTPETVTAHTWKRILDASSPIHAIVAEDSHGEVIGVANYVIHETTSSLAPFCLMQDLFVDPAQRAGGAGKAMIDWLVQEMSTQGWARLYWHTKENNYRARGLYDKYVPHSGFLRYVIPNPSI